MTTKECATCHQDLPLTAFAVHRKKHHGRVVEHLRRQCLSCWRAMNRAYNKVRYQNRGERVAYEPIQFSPEEMRRWDKNLSRLQEKLGIRRGVKRWELKPRPRGVAA